MVYISSKWESNSDLDMAMVSEGEDERLCVSKEPVRSKVAVEVDRGRYWREVLGVRRRRREAALDDNIVDLLGETMVNCLGKRT
jgi:hypothetical protein